MTGLGWVLRFLSENTWGFQIMVGLNVTMTVCHIADFSRSDACGDLNAWSCDSPSWVCGSSRSQEHHPRRVWQQLRYWAVPSSSQASEVEGSEGLFPLKSGSSRKKIHPPTHNLWESMHTCWHKQHAPTFRCTCGWSRSWVPQAWAQTVAPPLTPHVYSCCYLSLDSFSHTCEKSSCF